MGHGGSTGLEIPTTRFKVDGNKKQTEFPPSRYPRARFSATVGYRCARQVGAKTSCWRGVFRLDVQRQDLYSTCCIPRAKKRH